MCLCVCVRLCVLLCACVCVCVCLGICWACFVFGVVCAGVRRLRVRVCFCLSLCGMFVMLFLNQKRVVGLIVHVLVALICYCVWFSCFSMFACA